MWFFPPWVVLGAGEFLVVMASGKDRASEQSSAPLLHTNFKIKSHGTEYLALARPSGDVVWEHDVEEHVEGEDEELPEGTTMGRPREVEDECDFRAGDEAFISHFSGS